MRRIYCTVWAILLLPLIFGCANCQSGRQGGNPAESQEVQLTLKVESLDRILRENSGLIYFRKRLWTINDSGGDPVIYAFSPASGKVLQIIEIGNAQNMDWEEIAQDSKHIYVGDVGNNYGRRDRGVIYKVPKNSIPLTANASVEASRIIFSYEDRETGLDIRQGSSHDCEAFFICNDSIWLFTKDWQQQASSLYKMPVVPGRYRVSASALFQSGGLITGADISDDLQFVVLTGYRDYVPFVWVLFDYTLPDILSGRMERFDFPDIPDLQNEGIAVKNASRIFISSERTSYPPRLYTLDLSGFLDPGK
jgi:hypothetical protein